jgi:hypothetical protein
MRVSKFKDRYVLAEGYPWALAGAEDVKPELIERNTELWTDAAPHYRLVLEKVEDEDAAGRE